jgi:cob(I)alamin adenosyltransferase
MTHFYTSTGDDGYTGQLGEGRVPKDHPRIESVGSIDEANAALGVARAFCQASPSPAILLAVQRDLYGLMSEVSATPENAARFRAIDAARVRWVEAQIEAISAFVDVPDEFIVPGDSQAGAALDMARAIVRRAERQVVHLFHQKQLENPELVHYLNRLSSLCFILELLENQAAGEDPPTLAKPK